MHKRYTLSVPDSIPITQVMLPMRKQAAKVNQLNTALQALLNPPSHTKPELSLGG